MRAYVREAFSEWISHCAYFAINPVPLAEGWCCMMVASEMCRQWLRVEYPGRTVSNMASGELDSNPPLVGSDPPRAERGGPMEDTGCGWATRMFVGHPRGRPPKS